MKDLRIRELDIVMASAENASFYEMKFEKAELLFSVPSLDQNNRPTTSDLHSNAARYLKKVPCQLSCN